MQIPDPGSVFCDRYRLYEQLGKGGFARVFRAVDLDTGEAVALKVLTPDEPGGYRWETQRRFQREVELVAQLMSPYVVRLLGHGKSPNGLLYLVFELVWGRDLSEVLDDVGTLGEDVVEHVLQQVLFALHEAHGLGLLHRDLKPDNIRVFERAGDPWAVKVLDFGIAKDILTPAQTKVTKSGALVGTPRYMSPEQLMHDELTPASDLYSLGVTAYEMLMGSDAMHGASIHDQLDRLAFTGAMRIPQERAARLQGLVRRMVSRERARRPQSAAEVLRELGIELKPQTDGRSTSPRPSPTFPRWRGLAAAGAIAITGAAVFLATLTRSPEPEPDVRPVVVDIRPNPLAAERSAADAPMPLSADAEPTRDTPNNVRSSPSSGCGKPLPAELSPGKLHEIAIPNGREVQVYVPSGYDPATPHPVVLLFHDAWNSARGTFHDTAVHSIADTEGLIVVAPRDRIDIEKWTGADDLVAARDALRLTENGLCVDYGRIFAVGNGDGARFVDRLRCEMPELSAIATANYRAPTLECASSRPVPHIRFAMLKNRHLPVEGGEDCTGTAVLSLAEQEEIWGAENGCAGERRTVAKRKQMTCWSWECDAALWSCHVDAGRGWPRLREPRRLDVLGCDGDPPKGVPMIQTAWEFFEENAAPIQHLD